MKSKKRNFWLYLFYLLLTVGILVFVLGMNDLGEINAALKGVDVRYVLAAVGLLLVYMGLYPLTLCILARSRGIGAKFGDVYVIGMTEHFFNGITPFSTGGQPFQAYALGQKNVKYADSTGLLIMNFVIHMVVTNLYALASLVYFDKFVTTEAMKIIAIVGYCMNFLTLLFIISLGTSKTVKKVLVWLMRQVARIPFLKKWLEPKIDDFVAYADNTQAAFKQMWHDKVAVVKCFFVRLVTMFCYYAITFYVIKAMRVDIGYDKLPLVVLGSSFAITMVVFLPTPGSSGGIEFAFSSIFAALAIGAASSVSYCGMLIWRLVTYYFAMLVSLVFYIVFEIRRKVHPTVRSIEGGTDDSEAKQQIAPDSAPAEE